MLKKYFGTDGIRGRVGKHPISPDWILKLGWAFGSVLKQQLNKLKPSDSSNSQRYKVLIGKDTRISGYMFESALEAGLVASGMDILLLGPMPTPAIAYLTRTLQASAGIVISASHNKFYDNGIKFINGDGYKLSDDFELQIEVALEQSITTVDSGNLGKAKRVVDAEGRYIEFCKSSFPSKTKLNGYKIVLDCANGATYNVAPSVFSELGAEVIAIGISPDGMNINASCGSTSTEKLAQTVINNKADLGIAFDGDGDRAIMVDHTGAIVDGDEMLFIIAKYFKEHGLLTGGIVGTQMTNLGLEQALAGINIPFVRSKVGDRYVLESMQEHCWNLGGEGSGHIICLDLNTTGDGIVAALQVLAAMCSSGKSLFELKNEMQKLPQILLNVPSDNPKSLVQDQKIIQAVLNAELKLQKSGRVLLRPSGTEPLVRIMVEGEDVQQINKIANEIKESITSLVTVNS